MKLTLCDFESSQGLKEIGFDWGSKYFYVKPGSKMFGIDEHGRTYSIGKSSKKLYKIGEYATLNLKNVINTGSLELASKWFRDVHNIHIISTIYNRHPNIVGVGNELRYYYIILYPSEYGGFGARREIYEYPTLINKTDDLHIYYEQALLKGIKEAIKIVKNKQNGR